MTSLISELEDAFIGSSPERRNSVMRGVTDLFMVQADGLTGDQIKLFDAILCKLIEKIENKAVAELSGRVAPIPTAPLQLVKKLSWSDDISIAGPMLGRSDRLTDADLVEIAKVKSQGHLAAIAGRRVVSEIVTDVLVERGDNTVVNKVAGNSGARFSHYGYNNLVAKAHDDAALAATILDRNDLSPEMLNQLVAKAAYAVQKKLAAHADPQMREKIFDVLTGISQRMARGPKSSNIDPADAALMRTQFSDYADGRNLPKCIAVLASLIGVPADSIKRLTRERQTDAILIACRAADLNWPAVQQFLSLATGRPSDDMKPLLQSYIQLQAGHAQRVIRFFKARKALSADNMARLLKEKLH